MLICDISILHKFGKKLLDKRLSEIGLNWERMVVILSIGMIPQLNHNLLGQMLQTDKSNVTKLIIKMEEEGLLLRQPHRSDARRNLYILTTKAQDFVPRLKVEMSAWEDSCYESLSPEQIELYKKCNEIIIRNVTEGAVNE